MSALICQSCARSYAIAAPIWRCECGGLLDLQWQPIFDLEAIARRPATMWRYREALPIEEDRAIVSFAEGFTPLLPLELGSRRVLVKQDHLFPSGSYKDRGASVMISKVKELGMTRVVEDSSGNAGAAVAAYCARAGIGCEIYVPAQTSAGKLTQIASYGAKLQAIPGTREDTARAVMVAATRTYYASHSWSPFFFHGTKTWAFEVCEQLGWRAPDGVILPVGNGTLLLGAALGFSELYEAGIIDHFPRLIGVQATHCAPLYQASRKGWRMTGETAAAPTLAEGIAIAAPVRGQQILEAVRTSGGRFLAVTEQEIQDALHLLARRGYYIEPTAAATIAGVRQIIAKLDPQETIVTSFTGHGLKSTDKLNDLMQRDVR